MKRSLLLRLSHSEAKASRLEDATRLEPVAIAGPYEDRVIMTASDYDRMQAQAEMVEGLDEASLYDLRAFLEFLRAHQAQRRAYDEWKATAP